MKKFTKSLLIIALAIIPMTFFGQEKTAFNNWYFGIEGGATTMFADNEAFLMDQTSWDAGLYAGYTVKNALSFYVDLGYVNLKGKNGEWMTIDECNLFQGNINVGYNVLQLFGFDPDRRWNLMPHFGLGAIMHRTKSTINGQVIKNGYDDEGAIKGNGIGGRKAVYTNNFGIKVAYNISQRFDIGLDFVTVKTDTEGLDNWRYGKHSDWYGYANVAVSYKFGRKDVKPCPDCPECEPDQDAINQAIADAIKDYIENNPCPEPEPEVEEVEEVEATEIVWEEKDIHLTFKVNKADVEKTQANYDEVKKISDDLDAGREISVIRTVGYASPEGNEEKNAKLAEARAEATSTFIKENLGEQAEGIDFESEGIGSDWEGFYTALENSTIANKAEIAETIKNSENPTATLNKMRAQYPELNEILNNLRRTQILVK